MKEAYAQSIECEEPCEGRLSNISSSLPFIPSCLIRSLRIYPFRVTRVQSVKRNPLVVDFEQLRHLVNLLSAEEKAERVVSFPDIINALFRN